MRKFFEFINQLDRRVIFIFVALAIIIPLLHPLNIKFTVTEPVQGFYDAIEKVPEGSKVLFSCDYEPGSRPELFPMTVAALEQMLKRKLRVIALSLWPAGPPIVEEALSDVAEKQFHSKYGEDYVNLGFKEGREVVMVSMGSSIPTTFPQDFRGTKVSEFPIMQGVNNFSDVKLIVNISGGYPGTKEWVQQVQARYNIGLVSGCTAVSAPEYYPYYQSGQLRGLLGGMKGAAEYEMLVGKTGLGRKGMDAQSMAHLIIFLFIVLGNLAYFSLKKKKA